MKVLITGGSGLIGKSITKELLNQNVEVVHLTRNKNSACDVKTYEWNWEKGTIDEACFKSISHVIHLAGESVAEKPWTMDRKRLIVKSRVHTARLLHKKIAELNIPLKAFISASGVGYYGAQNSKTIFSENDAPYNDFISKCCVQWEEAADQFNNTSRVVKIRLGIVLDKNQGALPKISSMINKGIGASLGTGRQYMPWIHLKDVVNLFLDSLENDNLAGVYNGVAPEHKTNAEFTKEVAAAMEKTIRLPRVPSFVVKSIYGELANLLLYSSKVNAEKILNTGFEFKYSKLKEALTNIYN